MDVGNIIPLKKATQKDVKRRDFTIRSEYKKKEGGVKEKGPTQWSLWVEIY